MFKNHIKIALRTILKARAFSLINIAGLAIGMATFLLILQYVNFELSYDAFHANSDRIYRVKTNYIRNSELIYDSADNFAGVGPALKRELNEVRDFVRLYNAGAKFNCVITYAAAQEEPVHFNEKKLFFADASFFTVFSYPLLAGEPATALTQPNTAVVSESTAKKYFGADDPLGKIIQLNDDAGHEESFTITGVFRDGPENSYLQFNILLSYKTLHGRTRGVERYENSWAGRDNFLTYIELESGTPPEEMQAKLPAIIDKYKPTYTENDAQGERIRSNTFVLQPLRDIHLTSHLSNEAEVNGDGKIVYLLAIIAVFVLMIAWINYINLSAARMFERVREVGIRKTTGASHWQLMRQFLVEAVLLNAAALTVAFGLFEISLPYFKLLTGKSLEILSWQASPVWWLLPITFVLGTFISGIYPAFLAASFTPAAILSGVVAHVGRGFSLRKSLVVLQFVISIALASATIIVYYQLQFMREHDLGFNPEQILILKKPAHLGSDNSALQRYRNFKLELLKYPTVSSVAGSNIIPGQGFMAGLAISSVQRGTIDDIRSFHDFWTDSDFLRTYGMTFLAGRDFMPENRGGGADSSAMIFSESAAKQLGFASAEDAIGKDVFLFGSERHTVIGVIKDYHHEQLQKPQNPTMFKLSTHAPDFFSIKLNAINLREALAAIELEWGKHFPGNPFDFFFLDDFFNEQYKAYQRLGEVFSLFAVLALLIASLGLLGLVSYAVTQRTKEIGIRKVLGATVTNVTALLSKDFIKLVLLANVIAWPVTWLAMTKWLQDFAYRIDIGWWVFALAGGLALVIALVTVSTQAIRAALANPVDSLRYE